MANRRTPEMRSALLAGSYARWLAKHNPYPVVAPPFARSVLPIPLSRARDILKTAWHQGETGKHTCRCVESVLRSCRHPDRARVFDGDLDAIKQSGRFPLGMSDEGVSDEGVSDEEAPTPISWFDTDIQFDRDSSVTTVEVCSLFDDVPEPKGEEFILFAEPTLWSERVEFFQASTPGRWGGEAEAFEVDEWWSQELERINPQKLPLTVEQARYLVPAWRRYAAPEYFIFEHAQWQWSPEEAGDVMNELKIDGFAQEGKTSTLLPRVYATLGRAAQNALDDLAEEARRKREPRHELEWAELSDSQSALEGLAPAITDEPAAVHVVKYNYALHRSLRSHFLSSWVNGGLIVDDGTYEAAWYPKKNGLGMLCIRVDKQIGFTRSADVIEDYSKFLNLLAPALASMLVEELVYYSVLNFLGHGAGQDDSRGTEPPLSMTNRKGLSPNVNAG